MGVQMHLQIRQHRHAVIEGTRSPSHMESLADERDLHTPIRMDFHVFYVKERPTIIPARALVFVQKKSLRLLPSYNVDTWTLEYYGKTIQ
jgi:hypothetical protein